MKIVSHRFRGFGEFENSPDAFNNALEQGVCAFEFDVRVTKDNALLINHDPFIKLDAKNKVNLTKINSIELYKARGINSNTPLPSYLSELLDLFVSKGKEKSLIFIDVKDFGAEKEIYQLLAERKLIKSTVIVSWLPEVLFAFHKIDKNLPLCFSHNYIRSNFQYTIVKFLLGNDSFKKKLALLIKPFSTKLADALPEIKFYFEDYNSRESSPGRQSCNCSDFEHTLNGPVTGKLMEIIEKSKGYLCIQYRLIDRNYLSLYKSSPSIIPYSINSETEIEKFIKQIKPDYILSDNPALVSKF